MSGALSVAIMGHPRRSEFVEVLRAQLPGAEVVLDRKNDRWETGRRSLLAYDPGASHHLVVQDDAILCRDLVAGAASAASAASAAGDRPLGLYVGKTRPHRETVTPALEHARHSGAPWLEMKGPWWGVGIVIPVPHIEQLVAWGDAHPKIRNYDRRIAAWYEEQGIDCWYTVPSLVDHRPVAQNPSLVEGRTGNRQAHFFIGEDESALDVDWSKPPVTIDCAFRHKKNGMERRAVIGTPRYRRLVRHRDWEVA